MNVKHQTSNSGWRRAAARQRGAAVILAMMFLVIFGALAAAMAIVAQGNLATADTHMKINRTLASAETGLQLIIYRINQVCANITTRDGIIDSHNDSALWAQVQNALLNSFSGEMHNVQEPYVSGNSLHIGPIEISPDMPTFTVTLTPHPLPGENYDSAYYQRPPYSTMNPPVSSANPLDGTWIRVRVASSDGPPDHVVTRAIQMDFQLQKKIRYAILSKSRVMIGQNVLIDGPVGSSFTEDNLPNGHPIQMESDFFGLNPTLDAQLTAFENTLATNDKNGDNRLNIHDPAEVQGISDPAQYDTNGDGYIDDYDFFLAYYDKNGDGKVSATELDTADNPRTAELLKLIDSMGNNDGFIDNGDNYAKIHGQVTVAASLSSWQNGAAGGMYQNYFQGPIKPDYGQAPVTFSSDPTANNQYQPSDFNVSSFAAMATGDLASQASAQYANHNPSDPTSPNMNLSGVTEAVPYGSAHPYDYYTRPVYQNMTFTNVTIPKGTNALFENCKFIGCTFVATDTNNTDPNFNYAGMQEADGTAKYPNMTATVDGTTVSNTKTVSNNIRFDSCTFEGAVVSDSPQAFTQVRNKLQFTGTTDFTLNTPDLTPTQQALFQRSTLLVPNYSVDMGTFTDPGNPDQSVQLSGTIVAGIIDMRGNVTVNGTILTTFQPQSNTGPVIGDTSPEFNTTLGYFSSAQGDMESEIPPGGALGMIRVRYDPNIALPDGILSAISLAPDWSTYFETGAQ